MPLPRWSGCVCLLVMLCLERAACDKCSYTIVVAYSMSGASGEKNFTATAQYLTQTAGAALMPIFPQCASIKFTYRPFDPDPADTHLHKLRNEMLAGEDADFLVTGPRINACAQDVATAMLTTSFNQTGERITGSMLVRRDSGIRSYADLRNRTIGVMSPNGASYFLLQAARMAEMGLNGVARAEEDPSLGYRTRRKPIHSVPDEALVGEESGCTFFIYRNHPVAALAGA